MKNALTATALLVGTLVSASALAAPTQSYDVKVFNLDSQAMVKVSNNGQPVKGVPVEVKGSNFDKTYTTTESGNVLVNNYSDQAQSLKITVQEPNGEHFTTQRYLASHK
ncbi:hypothetical protein OAP63_13460 [Vibrio sp.]|nr:hypothetical protein [Vibrio sp.]